MPENNCSQKVLIRNLCGPMRHVSWQKKVQKGMSDSVELKNYLCVKCWLSKQEVAISVPTGISFLFSLSFLLVHAMICPRFTE